MKKLFLFALLAVSLISGCLGGGASFTITTTSASLPAGSISTGAMYPPTTLAAANGTAPLKWAVTMGALPPGLTLSSAGVLSGAATASGTFNFTVQATDSAGHMATASLSITINGKLTITSAGTLSTIGTVGSAYPSTSLSATGGVGPLTWMVNSGNLPNGLSLSGTGSISGTISSTVTPGSYNFTAKVTDSQGGTAISGTITIMVVAAPTITSFTPAAATITAGSSTTLTAVFSNGTGSVNNGVGAVTSGTPVTVTPAATTTYTLTVTNTAGVSVTAQTTVTVVPAPTITSFTPAAATITAGTSTTLTAVFSGGTGAVNNGVGPVTSGTAVTVSPAATTTYTLTVTNAAGASVTKQTTVTVVPAPVITSFVSAAATITAGTSTTLTGVFSNGTGSVDNGVGAVTSGTPVTVSPATTTTYTLTVTNAANTSVTKQVTVTVVPAPVITSFVSAAATITAGTSTTLTGVFSNGTGSVDNGVGSVTSGTAVPISPAATTTYTLTVTNSVGTSVTKQVTVTVVPPPSITSFTAGMSTIVVGGSTTLTAVFSNGTGSVDHSVGAVTSGTPVNISPTTTTTYTLTVANAAGTSVTAQVTVTVDIPPMITSGSGATFTVGANQTFTVTTTGNPTPTLSESGPLPLNVSFHDNGNGTGTLSGTPASGTAGTYPIMFTASNGVGTNATQSFTLTVVLTQPPAITSASSAAFTVSTLSSFTVTTTGAPTPALSETGPLPGGVTFTDKGNGTATIAGTAAATGTFNITITAANGVSPNATQAFTLNVVAAPVITSFSAAAGTITAGTSTTLTAVFSGGTGAVNNGVGAVTSGTAVTVTPAATTTYTLTVTNTAGASVTSQATVTVVPAPVITSFTANPTTIVVGNSATLTPVFSNGTGSIDNGVGPVASGTGVTVSPTTTTTYTLTVTNSATTPAKTTLSVTVNVQTPAMITSASSATFILNAQSSFTVTATGTPTPTLSESGALPAGVTFAPATGLLSGAPTATGTFPIVFTAHNGVGADATQNFTLTVSAASACTSGGSESLLSGGYAFLLTGFDSSGNPVLIGGVLTFDGAGHITTTANVSVIDINQNSGSTTNNVTSGCYQAGSDHRGFMSITTAAGTLTFRFSLGNISGTPAVASRGHVIGFDTAGPFVTGIMRKQSGGPFMNSSVSGSFAFGASGIQNAAVAAVCSGKLGVVGVADFDGINSITGGFEDVNQCGKLDGNSANTTWPASPVPITGGTYNVSPNGHGTLTLTIAGITFHDVIFLVSSSEAMFMVSDAQTAALINAGLALKQSGGPFMNSSVSGTFAGYTSALGSGGAGTTDVEVIVVNIATSITGNVVGNDAGTLSSMALSGITYNVAASGRTLLSGAGVGSHAPLLWIVDAHHLFFLNSNGRVNSGFFESQTSISASGPYAFGVIDPEDKTVTDESGIVSFASGNISVLLDSNSSGTLTIGGTNSATFSVDSMGGIHIPSGCTTTCVLGGLVISPTRLVVIELMGTSNPKVYLADQ